MKTIHVKVAIIGAGSAGMSAYRAAREHTDSVVVIERGLYGTTCARVGCMPSKLLISAADAAHEAAKAAAFGVDTTVRVDGVRVMERVRRERDRFVGFVTGAVESWPDAHRLMGAARFLSPHELQVGDDTVVHAERIVIATGSSPIVPQDWRLAVGSKLDINDDVFDWNDLPKSIAVVGTGVIGLELAQALHRLGVRVRVYGRSQAISPLTDPAVRAVATAAFAEDMPMTLGFTIQPSLDAAGNIVVRATDSAGNESTDTFERMLVAMGRRPNLGSLNLDAAGLVLDDRGVPTVDPSTGQTSVDHIFLAGDATDELSFLHEASDEGRIAGDNAGRYPAVRRRPRRAPLAITFTDPQIAIAGQSFAMLTNSDIAFVIGEASFEDQGRSRVMLRNKGMVRVYADPATGRFLGAEMAGPSAEHIGHLLAWSAQRGDTVQQMLDSPFYHPVVEEGLRTALRHVKASLKVAPQRIETCLECHAA